MFHYVCFFIYTVYCKCESLMKAIVVRLLLLNKWKAYQLESMVKLYDK